MAIKARFTGKRDSEGLPLEFLNGVPARDLQDNEYDALSTEQKHDVRHSGLYKMAEPKPKAEAKPKDEKAAPEPAEGEG